MAMKYHHIYQGYFLICYVFFWFLIFFRYYYVDISLKGNITNILKSEREVGKSENSISFCENYMGDFERFVYTISAKVTHF
jgi:hypothetical protein